MSPYGRELKRCSHVFNNRLPSLHGPDDVSYIRRSLRELQSPMLSSTFITTSSVPKGAGSRAGTGNACGSVIRPGP